MSDPLPAFEKALRYRFRNKALAREALTHSSAKSGEKPSNERLEFLGDAVLGLVISEDVFLRFPAHQEGELTKLKSSLVSREGLTRLAQRLEMRRFLEIGKGIRGKIPPSLLANSVEAAIGAVYIDGGFKAARTLIHALYAREWKKAPDRSENAKSRLQEVAQHRFGAAPSYVVRDERGPEHRKTFRVAVLVAGKELGHGSGRTKKDAEQTAARDALDALEGDAPDANGS